MSGLRVVMLGGPGSGKGTQAVRLAEAAKVPHISTGDMFRRHVAEGTPLGRRAKSYLDAGTLVPDDVVTDMVKDRLLRDDCAAGFLLDGFPRTVPQAQALDRFLAERGLALSHVALLDVPEAELTRRLLARGRSDDTPETVRRRLEVYAKDTEPLVAHFRRSGLLRRIGGTGTPDEVFARLLRAAGGAAR